jgi:hypothetical protein
MLLLLSTLTALVAYFCSRQKMREIVQEIVDEENVERRKNLQDKLRVVMLEELTHFTIFVSFTFLPSVFLQ